jgi:hypothetical protein
MSIYIIMINYMDTMGLSVQTPIDTFEHPGSGSIIDVVSTMHVGSVGYYNKLHDHLSQRLREGFFVVTEGIRESTSDEVAQLGPLGRLKHRAMARPSLNGVGLLELIYEESRFDVQHGLEDLLAEGAPEGKMINADMSMAEVAQHENVFALFAGSLDRYVRLEKFRRQHRKDPGNFDRVVYEAVREQTKEAEARQPSQGKRLRRSVTVDRRNQGVIDAVDNLLEADPASCVALVWGYGHRPGLVAAIQDRGYKNTGHKFLTVAFKPPAFNWVAG